MIKKTIPIGVKLFLGFFILITFFLILIGLFINSIYAEVLRNNEVKYNLLASDKTKTQFDFTNSLIQNTTSSLSNNTTVRQFLLEIENGTQPDMQNAAEVENLLAGILEMQSFIENIHVVSTGDQVVSGRPLTGEKPQEYNYAEYFQRAASGEATEFWSGGNAHPLFYILPVYRTNPRKVIGLLVLDINYDFVREMFMVSAIRANERVMVVNSQGQIIFNFPHYVSYTPFLEQHPEILQYNQLQVEGMVYGQESIIVMDTVNMSDWKIIRLITKKDITKETSHLSTVLRNLLFISAIIGSAYSFLLSRFITKPIRKLSDACQKAEQGDLSIQVEIGSNDEVGNLGRTFNMMISQIRISFEKEISEQKRKSQMQFQILQAQVNPHFLYNTLDSIKWMAVMQNANNIAEMSTALISLLKYNLAHPDAMTTLREEVESVRYYVRIQRFRYSDNFDFSTQMDPDTLDCVVLRFILQPLVENSIIHGFEDVERSYKMRISSYIQGERLHIKIIDNGSGMNPERIRTVNEGLKQEKRYNHIGVQNIRERIKLHFGEEYGLFYSSEPFVGTIAEIVLPLHDSKKESDEIIGSEGEALA